MYPGQSLTVVVRNPYYFERYFMDYQNGQLALAPDVASAIAGGILTPLAKAQEFLVKAQNFSLRDQLETAEPKVADCSPTGIRQTDGEVKSNIALYHQCLARFAADAKTIYRKLEPATSPDSHAALAHGLPASDQTIDRDLQDTANGGTPNIADTCAAEFELSASIAAAAKDSTDPEILNLSALAAIADAIAKDLFAYGARISDLPSWCTYFEPHKVAGDGSVDCKDTHPAPVVLHPIPDPETGDRKQATRQVTYNLDAFNLVQNTQEAIPDSGKKRTLAAITILYGDSRWEASAGTFFSTLAVRSFNVSPVFAGNTVTDKQITQSVLHPTIVPFAGANYRLTPDFGGRWRSAIYLTGAVGINPNTTSADFAAGPSISWRALMFSALFHYGHDVRLTQGLTTGASLGAGFSGSISTQTYWRKAFAIGVAVRVPALTGR
jgi:hypothetical protein